MSITYPEVRPTSASMNASGANVMNAGSALFPGGAAKVYDRAATARSRRGLSVAWIAAPVAVVLIGGAVYLSTAHHPAAVHGSAAPRATAPVLSAQTVSSTTTTRDAAPAALKVMPVEAPAAPVLATRHVETHTRIVQAPAARPVAAVTRSSATRTQAIHTAPAAPVASAPVMAAPAQAVIPAATPGTFAFTPAPASAASDSAQPMSQSTAPATTDTGLAPTAAAPSADQASPQ